MLPSQFIREKIVQAFDDLAEAFSAGTVEIPGMTEDEEAGIPMLLFTAQQTMLVAWQSYLSGHASAPRRPNNAVHLTPAVVRSCATDDTKPQAQVTADR